MTGVLKLASGQVGFICGRLGSGMGLEGKAILDRVSIMKKQTEGEIIKMSINRRIDKLWYMHAYNKKTLYSNKGTNDICNKMDIYYIEHMLYRA